MFKRTNDQRDVFIARAREEIGYTARAGRDSFYGATVGYNGQAWDGAFIDVIARETGVSLPAMVYSPAGLSWFIRTGRVYPRPQPGDVVFYTWSTGEYFDSPHVGIVSEVTDWDSKGRFRAIEANVDAGTPRGSKLPDGVYERTRYSHDVLAFGRPAWGRKPKKLDGQPAKPVKLSHVQPGNRKYLENVQRVQEALVLTCSLRGYKPGLFDGSTKSAFAQWQRSIGYVGDDASGVPDTPSLTRLGQETGLFSVIP